MNYYRLLVEPVQLARILSIAVCAVLVAAVAVFLVGSGARLSTVVGVVAAAAVCSVGVTFSLPLRGRQLRYTWPWFLLAGVIALVTPFVADLQG